MSDQLAGVVFGGLITLTVGALLLFMSEWRARGEWRRKAQLDAGRELVGALQQFNRTITNLAQSTATEVDGDSPVHVAMHQAANAWNTARFRIALICPAGQVARVDAIDLELDRLMDLAVTKQWSTSEFRRERVSLGLAGAEYISNARTIAREGDIGWSSLWPWAGQHREVMTNSDGTDDS